MKKHFLVQWAQRVSIFLTCTVAFNLYAQPYPNRPINMILPFPTGGGTDVAARLFAKYFSEELAQNVVVDNRPGAGGNLGAGLFAKSQPDGYTLLFTAQSPVTIADSVSKNLSFNPQVDLVPVVLTQLTPVLVVVPSDLPVKNLNDLIHQSHALKANLNFGSPGAGNEFHLVSEWLKKDLKMDITHIPYKGSGPALIDLIAGRIQMMVASPASVSQYMADGRLRAIATLSKDRLSGFPKVPTAVESGFPSIVYDAWFGLFVPLHTPPLVITRLEKAAQAISQHAAYRNQVIALGMLPVAMGASEFKMVIKKNREVWSNLVPSLSLSEDIYK
ncbi:MAG: tripartite tricarboxylate transporter substrate binding protein [Betaproteobacteria bacterium]|jgi:tripartite-type tricarboxylate transporter receptor subunit TctC